MRPSPVYLADAGAKVVINYVTNPETADAIAVDIKHRGDEAIALKADIANEAEVKAMYAAIFKQYGTIDILCANAGIQVDAPFVEMTLDQWNKVLAVNLTGQFLWHARPPANSSAAVSARKFRPRPARSLHEFGASGDSVGSSRQLCGQQRRDSHADADYRAGIGTIQDPRECNRTWSNSDTNQPRRLGYA